MLQIKKISKQYKTGDLVQNALKDVSLNLRDNEFVSILGPSGSGKTTLLNIIGGLDRYDKGDLIINNVSTKHYKDRDWDSYRNHTIGFVFQSYNLIPHQTVLANVELALTIGGISKRERKRRALEALDKVGLKDQAHKKPNQMSGGQMQRVAIARALINNPDILLADEPTGALDTETSVQVMELLKQVANDRLVIMVTHNPELAEEYSTRIVRLKDGEIIGDTNPFNPNESKLEKPKHKNLGKSSMSILTAFSLSLNNLFTKKARTILTSFAGSIGIIGIALILALSTGFQNYIDKMQEDTLTSYPLTVTLETADTASMLLSMVAESEEGVAEGTVKENQTITNMFSKIGTNDLKSFKTYLEGNSNKVDEMVSLVQYQYGISPLIYTKNVNKEITQLNPSKMMTTMSGTDTSMMNSMSSSMGMSTSIFNQMINDREMLESQYNVIAGRWPESYDEVILILPDENSISDLLLYSLGLRDDKELEDMMAKLMKGEKVENVNSPLELTYEELMSTELKLVDATATYKYNSRYDVYESMTDDKEYMQDIYDKATNLKVVGIICPESDSSMMSGVGYTKALTEHVINEASKSEIVQKQLANEEINVFSNKRFDDDSNETAIEFNDLVTIDTETLNSAFGGDISEAEIASMTEGYMSEISSAITTDTTKAQAHFTDTLTKLVTDMLNEYITNNQTAGVAVIKLSDVETIVNNFMEKEGTKAKLAELESEYIIPQSEFTKIYSETIKGFLTEYIKMTSQDKENPSTFLVANAVEPMVKALTENELIIQSSQKIASGMVEASMQKTILTKVGELTGKLMEKVASGFNVDEEKIASAFQMNIDEDEMRRLFETMASSSSTQNSTTNLLLLGYQDINEPSSISFYFKNFDSKELFINFIDEYNEKMEAEDDEKVIKYTDITGILMSSVSVIVDSVSYVLIAFVSISLIVSSIMIGIITYISVLERTKEIGVLRAIGASKRNISSIFNAETFIVGLFAGLIGIGVSLLLLIPINSIIHAVTGNPDIVAVLPLPAAMVLIILSVILTLIGGIIPSKKAAKKDPVLALRTE